VGQGATACQPQITDALRPQAQPVPLSMQHTGPRSMGSPRAGDLRGNPLDSAARPMVSWPPVGSARESAPAVSTVATAGAAHVSCASHTEHHTMRKAEIVQRIAQELACTTAQAAGAVEAILSTIKASLRQGEPVRERNKKVAVHPCREHLCVPDARRGGTRGHTWPSRGARRVRRGTRWQGRGRAWALGQRGVLVCSPVWSLSSKRRSWEHTEP